MCEGEKQTKQNERKSNQLLSALEGHRLTKKRNENVLRMMGHLRDHQLFGSVPSLGGNNFEIKSEGEK